MERIEALLPARLRRGHLKPKLQQGWAGRLWLLRKHLQCSLPLCKSPAVGYPGRYLVCLLVCTALAIPTMFQQHSTLQSLLLL